MARKRLIGDDIGLGNGFVCVTKKGTKLRSAAVGGLLGAIGGPAGLIGGAILGGLFGAREKSTLVPKVSVEEIELKDRRRGGVSVTISDDDIMRLFR